MLRLYAEFVTTAYNQLSLQVTTLYSELVDHLLANRAGLDVAPRGSFVAKTVKGSRYWYLQVSALGKRKQIYLGADSEALRHEIERTRSAWEGAETTRESGAALVSMLRSGGAQGPDGVTGSVLEVLADHHVFDAGVTVVGSAAFLAFGPMLGVSWTGAYRTADVDVASERRLSVAVDRADVLEALRASKFVFEAIPGFDPRSPSTSFRARGRELRFDVVTPLVGKPRTEPIVLEHLGVAAQPLRFLDYLIEETIPCAFVHGHGALGHVPTPARFALHKLIVAAERRAHEAAKQTKDILQAGALLELLGDERPGDLERAWSALESRGDGWTKRARRSARRLSEPARKAFEALS